MIQSINAEAIPIIRKALVIGLASFGELNRLEDEFEKLELAGYSIPNGIKIEGVSGDSESISAFAAALHLLEYLDQEINDQK